jgi:hypothetical protein
MEQDHLQRIKDALNNTYTLSNLSGWIAKHTKHDGLPLSYTGREYQIDVIDDPAKELYVLKCAQVGLSEILARWGIATAVTQRNFTTIYTFPAANDAYLFAKARLDPVIAGSAEIRRALSKDVNSVELKQFNENSFLYVRGTYSETGALSVPADLLIHDEIDRSDMANVSAYVSRLQAKPTKMRRMFSTPTVAKYGIHAFSLLSKRKKQMWTCSCCNHTFVPSYHTDVKIPGYIGALKEITPQSIKDLRWREAKLLCPSCGREPSNELRYRQWVVENPHENFDAVSYFISPFCAPAFLTAPYLVEASTRFDKWSEFCNQALGETAEDSEETLSETDVREAAIKGDLSSSELHFMGVDFGLTCHVMIGRVTSDGTLLVVHREKVVYTKLEERRRELAIQYRNLVSVHDLFPYTDMVTRIVESDPNAFGAIYVEKKSTENFTIREQEEKAEEGKLNVRSVMVNRNVALDALMQLFKQKKLVIANLDDDLVLHLQDMKRVKKFDKFGVMRYVWEKTQGYDHYHHALLYLFIATQMRGLAGVWVPAGSVSLVSSFRPKYGA